MLNAEPQKVQCRFCGEIWLTYVKFWGHTSPECIKHLRERIDSLAGKEVLPGAPLEPKKPEPVTPTPPVVPVTPPVPPKPSR